MKSKKQKLACKKCEGKDIHTFSPDCSCIGFKKQTEKNHIHYYCQKCNYDWFDLIENNKDIELILAEAHDNHFKKWGHSPMYILLDDLRWISLLKELNTGIKYEKLKFNEAKWPTFAGIKILRNKDVLVQL